MSSKSKCSTHFSLVVGVSAQISKLRCEERAKAGARNQELYETIENDFVFSSQVYADASLVFPLVVAETFARRADVKTDGLKPE